MEALKSNRWLILLLLAVALSRLPFLGAGYGENVDAWRVANVARALATTGEYEVSRFPGYPVQEIVCSWFWRGGSWALTGLSALCSVAAGWAFWEILRICGRRSAWPLTLAFASVPVFFINSVTAKDYVWALAFVLWALWAALRQRPWCSGLLLGLAIGCRMTSGAMILPLALLLWCGATAGREMRVVKMAALALAVGALCFIPVWARYGLHFLTFYDTHARPGLVTITARATLEVWGTLGCAGLGIATVGMLFRRRAAPDQPPGLAPALLLMIALYTIAYWHLPDQAGYLLPLVPAILLLAAQYSPEWAARALAILLCLAPWVELSPVGLRAGPIWQDHQTRERTAGSVEQFLRFSEVQLSPRSFIAVGAWEPILKNLLRGDERNRYVYLLDQAQIEAARAQGFQLAYASESIREFNLRVNHLDLAQVGAANVHALFTAPHR